MMMQYRILLQLWLFQAVLFGKGCSGFEVDSLYCCGTDRGAALRDKENLVGKWQGYTFYLGDTWHCCADFYGEGMVCGRLVAAAAAAV